MVENRNKQSAVRVMRPNPEKFCARVRQVAEDTRNIKWSKHARERMDWRDIPIRVALSIVREGQLRGDIVAGINEGEWKAKFVRNIPGRRDAGVVFLLIQNDRIFVKTVEWEDTR
jgi:hypothetical protein